MFKFRLNLTVFFLLASGIAALAQNTMLRGTVLDENDLPLPGTSVIIDGTTKGVITDVDGKFEILAGKGETLVVEFLGYVPKTLTVGNENNIRQTTNSRDWVILVKANMTISSSCFINLIMKF